MLNNKKKKLGLDFYILNILLQTLIFFIYNEFFVLIIRSLNILTKLKKRKEKKKQNHNVLNFFLIIKSFAIFFFRMVKKWQILTLKKI